jgi:hypothetical protein
MRYKPSIGDYLRIGVVGALAGCSPGEMPPSQLEQTVHANGSASAPANPRKNDKLDLSTPEGAATYILRTIQQGDKKEFKRVTDSTERDVERIFKEFKNLKDFKVIDSNGSEVNVNFIIDSETIQGYIEVKKKNGGYIGTGLGPR